MNTQARLAELTAQLDVLATRKLNARKNQQWDLVDDLYQQEWLLDQEHYKIKQQLQFQADIQAMDDWYDDDKNRDAYNERIVSMYLN
jgi:hypothetical protein